MLKVWCPKQSEHQHERLEFGLLLDVVRVGLESQPFCSHLIFSPRVNGCEIDALLLTPHGFFIFELKTVKKGEVVHATENQWTAGTTVDNQRIMKGGSQYVAGPHQQVVRYRHNLAKFLKENSRGIFSLGSPIQDYKPYILGCVLVFPPLANNCRDEINLSASSNSWFMFLRSNEIQKGVSTLLKRREMFNEEEIERLIVERMGILNECSQSYGTKSLRKESESVKTLKRMDISFEDLEKLERRNQEKNASKRNKRLAEKLEKAKKCIKELESQKNDAHEAEIAVEEIKAVSDKDVVEDVVVKSVSSKEGVKSNATRKKDNKPASKSKVVNKTFVKKDSVMLPEWLDLLIFNDMGARFCRRCSDLTIIDWKKEDMKDYLGTYFPRSYAEAYCIFFNFFSENQVVWEKRETLNIFDFGCGAGGEILGFLQAVEECLPNIKSVSITALDGNVNSLRMFEQIFEIAQKEMKIATHINLSPTSIDDLDDLDVVISVIKEKFDFIFVFKSICEFVTKRQFEDENPYWHIINSLALKLNENDALMAIVDVTTFNDVSQEWLPMMLDKGIEESRAKVIAKNHDYNESFYVTTSRMRMDKTKVAWRILEVK